MDHVAGSGFALGANHGRALGNAAQGFAQVPGAANKRSGKGVLVDVVQLVGRRQHLALIDEVDAQVLQYLRFGKMPDARLGHHRDRNRADNFLDQAGLGHARHAALGADHRRHPLQRHDRGGAGPLGNDGLLGAHHVHDDAALEHLSQAQLQPQSGAGNFRSIQPSVCLQHIREHASCLRLPRFQVQV